MAYLIQAFVSSSKNPNLLKLSIPCFSLAQDFVLVPTNKVIREKFEISALPLLEGNNNNLTVLCNFGFSLSGGAKVAYSEAELFGGGGMQASMVFENGKIIPDAIVSKNAINLALQYLGVAKASSPDEFDALGLGKYRNTEQWIDNSKNE